MKHHNYLKTLHPISSPLCKFVGWSIPTNLLLICDLSSQKYLNNIHSNFFIVQKYIKGSNISNYMVVEFKILFITEKIDNSISYHPQNSQVLFCGWPIRYSFACNSIFSSLTHTIY